MTPPAHTPGPWKVGTKHPGRVMAANGRGNVIAYCTPHPDDTDSPTEEEAANARLIAQAPALYEALKDCLERLEASQPPEGGRTQQVVNQVRTWLQQIEREAHD
jgi:hypothetical protein